MRHDKLMKGVVQHGVFMKRTCGSVRSSLSAPARLVTAGSEAAETMYLRSSGRGSAREGVNRSASVKADQA